MNYIIILELGSGIYYHTVFNCDCNSYLWDKKEAEEKIKRLLSTPVSADCRIVVVKIADKAVEKGCKYYRIDTRRNAWKVVDTFLPKTNVQKTKLEKYRKTSEFFIITEEIHYEVKVRLKE